MAKGSDVSAKSAKLLALSRMLEQVQQGDFQAENQLLREFDDLIRTVAQRRARGDAAEMSRLMDKGRTGLRKAVRKFRLRSGVAQFQVFALNYIEKAMDGKDKGFFSRIFGR